MPTDDERRLLELLAGSENGNTDALLTAYGFTAVLMVALVRVGLATAQAGGALGAARRKAPLASILPGRLP